MTRFLALALAALISIGSASAQSVSTPAKTNNASIVVTSGGTFQEILPAVTSPPRRSITIENNNTTANENCWIYIGPIASASAGTSIFLGPGGSWSRYFPYVPNDQISGTCLNNGDTIYADYN